MTNLDDIEVAEPEAQAPDTRSPLVKRYAGLWWAPLVAYFVVWPLQLLPGWALVYGLLIWPLLSLLFSLVGVGIWVYFGVYKKESTRKVWVTIAVGLLPAIIFWSSIAILGYH